MKYMYNGPILVLDLATQRNEERDLEPGLIERALGGAGISSVLYDEYQDEDPFIIGTGILTATLVPGAALGIFTGRSPITQKLGHAPFTLFGGSELKLSGFSFVVLKNKAEKPAYLWLHDGVADIEDGTVLRGQDTWETTDWIRHEHGEPAIQVLSIGRAGEARSSLAQISCNYWGSGDRFGFGRILGEKNVKAIAFRGLGEIEPAIPGEFLKKARALLGRVRGSSFSGQQGFEKFAQFLGVTDDISRWLQPFVHRYSSCFNCPYPCNTFVKYNENSNVLHSGGVEEAGLLLTNLLDVLSFKQFGADAETTLRALEKARRLGLEPNSSAEVLRHTGQGLKDLESLFEAQVKRVAPWPSERGEAQSEEMLSFFSTWTPFLPLFGSVGATSSLEENSRLWVRRNALAYITGICPVFMLMCAEYSEDILRDLVNLGYGTAFSGDEFRNMVLAFLKGHVDERFL